MSTVVQATCPGCQKLLRIPADWIQQPIRCKHCGLVMHAKPPAPSVPAGKQPSARPAKPNYVTSDPPAFARPAASVGGSPFDALEDEDDSPKRRRRRRNPNGRVVLFVSLLLIALTGVSVTVFYLKWGGSPGKTAVAQSENPGEVKDDPPIEKNPPKGNPRGDKDKRVVPEGINDPPVAKNTPFPRRALVISVHNYLYANPVSAGAPIAGARNIAGLLDKLSNGLRIPRNQIAHLSDASHKSSRRPPLKGVIENTLTKFLDSSRAQDRVMVFFIGHAVELNDEPFLVPLEGELDGAATLIPLKWVYEQLAKCPARQKVLVLDVCRFNPVAGLERPGGDPMGPKFTAAIQTPPAGVQVWAACGPEQRSYETENDAMGVFLDEMQACLERASEGKLKLQDKIQKPDDLFPLDRLKERVDEKIAKEVAPLKLTQTTLLAGKPADDGAAYDGAEAAPPAPVLASPPAPLPPRKQRELEVLLADVATPPVKVSRTDTAVNFSILPPFSEKVLEPYLAGAGGDDTDLHKAVRSTQALLYAISPITPPVRLEEPVALAKKTLKANLSILRDGYRAPANENAFKGQVLNDEKDVARIMARLNAAHEEMKTMAEQRDAEPKRWQAAYDFMLARLEAQIAYLYEYQSMLGQMRKELPPRDPSLHGGWKLAATTSLTGDSAGKKLAASSRKTLDKIIKDHAGTPWEVLAKREKLTALGLEWKPAK